MFLQKLTFSFVAKNLKLKKEFNDKRYIYILFCLIKPIKLYIESKTQQVANAEYKLKFIMPIIANETTFERKLVIFTCNALHMGIKYYRKQTNI